MGSNCVLSRDRMIHAKAILIDRQSLVVGSANIDQRSLFLNYEVVSFIYSAEVLAEAEKWMTELVKNCHTKMDSVNRYRRMG